MTSSLQILDILQVAPLERFTCCGLRRDGLPCGNRVAIASRQSAYDLLRQCNGAASITPRFRSNLKQVASLLLCKRWHQDQWSTVLGRWLNAYEGHIETTDSGYGSESEEIEEDDTALIFHQRHERRQSTPISTRASNMARNESDSAASALEKLVAAVLRSDISNDNKAAILQAAAMTTPDLTVNQARAAGSSRSHHSTPSGSVPSTPVTRPTTNRASTSSTTTPPATRVSIPRPLFTTRQTTPSTSTVPILTSSQRSLPVQSPSPASRRTVTNHTNAAGEERHSHTECAVCLEPYDDTQNVDIWECTECRNRTHLVCHTQWSFSQPGTTRCVFCRTVVPPIF